MEDTIDESWRKSTYSGNGGSDCVEVANAARVVLVRDTKDRDGGTLAFTADAWRRFLAEQQLGQDPSTYPGHPRSGVPYCCYPVPLSCGFGQTLGVGHHD